MFLHPKFMPESQPISTDNSTTNPQPDLLVQTVRVPPAVGHAALRQTVWMTPRAFLWAEHSPPTPRPRGGSSPATSCEPAPCLFPPETPRLLMGTQLLGANEGSGDAADVVRRRHPDRGSPPCPDSRNGATRFILKLWLWRYRYVMFSRIWGLYPLLSARIQRWKFD